MKKVKIVSFLVIIVLVVGIGVFLGKKAFKYLENKQTSKLSDQSSKDSNSLLSVVHANVDSGATQSKVGGEITFQVRSVNESLPVRNEVSAEKIAKGESLRNIQAPAASTTQLPQQNQNNPYKDYKGPLVAFAIGNGINVREGPNLDSKILMKVGKGTRGHVLEQKDGWTKIKWDFNKKVGWTRDDLLVIGPKGIVKGLEDFEIVDPSKNAGNSATASANVATSSKIVPKAKVSQLAQVVSVAVAKPVSPEETVRNYFTKDNLPSAATVISDVGANVRAEPDRKSALLGKLPKGMMVKIKDCKKVGKYNWFLISYSNGKKEGWVREDNLKF